ncbi:MAG TPA: HAD family hydrolase [Syntrophorhabdaceae bacterium]|nr:HAD family hydrolase [Syntrophorhabdaceae bacterium]
MHKAVFLDRDGTIIYDTGYPKDPEIIRLMPGVPEALSLIKQKGFKLIIVSNQSGIGRGILTEHDVDRINERILLLLNLKGISIDGIYYCPHNPEEACSCRKPSPEMLFRGAIDHNVDLSKSFMIGDKPSDIEAGKRAGCKTILICNSFSIDSNETLPDFFAKNWHDILAYFS